MSKKKKKWKIYAIRIRVNRPYTNAPVSDIFHEVFEDQSPMFFQLAKNPQDAKARVYELCSHLGIICNGIWISPYKKNKKKFKRMSEDLSSKDFLCAFTHFC